MLNATFINISVISLRLVLLLEETRRSRCSNHIILVVSLYRTGEDPWFQVRGAYFKQLRRAEGGAKIVEVFRPCRMLLYVGVHYWRPEICRWRMKFPDGFENIPISIQQSLSYAHDDFYPNIKRLYFM